MNNRYMGRQEVAQVARMMLNWPLIRFVLLLPILLLGPWLVSRCRRAAAEQAPAEG